MKRITIFLLFGFLFIFSIYSFGQHHSELPTLQELVHDADVVIEGKVMEKESFYDETKGHIYTKNKVKIYKQFKGDYDDSYIAIITKGGEYDDMIELVTHSFQLGLESKGLFFLNENTFYNKNFQNNLPNEVFSGHPYHGFIPYYETFEHPNPFAVYGQHKYKNIEQKLLQPIENITKQQRKIKSHTPTEQTLQDWIATQPIAKNGVEGIVEYTIENPSLTGALNEFLEFDINIASLLGSEEFFSGEILIDYNTLTFGSSLAASGIVTVTKGNVIFAPNYTILVTDVSPSQLKIAVTSSTNNPSTLYLVNNLSEQLVHLKIDLTNLAGNTGIDFDELNMQGVSEFFDISSNLIEPFDLVKADDELDIDVSALVVPQIDSIRPLVVRGGIDTLTIYGSNFGGNIIPQYSWVQFRNADKATGYMKPFDEDYAFWSDTLIKVKVPGNGKTVTIGGTSDQSHNYAGTGPVRVYVTGNTSNFKNLQVKFSVQNFFDENNASLSIPYMLINRNGIGGYTLTYDSTFASFPNSNCVGNSTPKTMFEKALITWRCASGLNFILDSLAPNLPIEPITNSDANKMIIGFEPLPVPAQTTIIIRELCDTNYLNQSDARYYVEKFKIKFDNNQSWWIDDDTSALIGSNYRDLQSDALHELGHAHLLNHTMNIPFGDYETMYYGRPSGAATRNIDGNNLAGGIFVTDLSSTLSPSNCYVPMQKVTLYCDIINDADEIYKSPIDVSIFPNPTNDKLNLKFNNTPSHTVELSLFDALGQIVAKSYHNRKELLSVDMSSLSNGIYFIRISIDGEMLTQKIVKY